MTESNQHSLFNSGQHCSLPNCNTLDFLPLLCKACQASFCKDHAPVFAHNCPSADLKTLSSVSQSDQVSFESIDDLISSHRPTPAASATTAQLERNARAKEVLDKHFPKTAKTTPLKPTISAAKKPLSPAIQLMLLKKRATCGDPKKKEGDVPPHERWYGTVNVMIKDINSNEVTLKEACDNEAEAGKPLWFPKKTITGKVFDLITDLLQSRLNSLNHTQLQLRVFRKDTIEPVILTEKCSTAWGDLVKDGEEVWVTRKQ
ncbi:uncharacterized protein MELLADRAFT_64796 [Melampsora larici-populina 98AG31]|uniref:AN1-type domain-containing protein n=1 Tax=Melampsora larici-populina (strain 98AG31 / pathotype 3-4-7) TaxID=747676 RepID=F4RSU1_MELLP|nr:uncharacterized protein MELLADRAFT_64796 [Melampsora larici-populina 98AG31]EGG04390.1 hypothetical protein MELLADRAFT_64796 [Melampsora larici-populina 98AG31]